MSRLEEIRARLAAATPGPWSASKHRRNADGSQPDWHCLDEEWGIYPPDHSLTGGYQYGGPIAHVSNSETNDADLIANAPADLAWLLECVESQKRILACVNCGARGCEFCMRPAPAAAQPTAEPTP